MKSFSFLPINSPTSKVLILGTMPGIKSLEMQQYYAHPRNSFWKILFTILGEDFSEEYELRRNLLLNNNIALWDVLQYCERTGSLDSAIRNEIVNDFTLFFKENPEVTTIIFNGQKAAALFKKHVKTKKSYHVVTMPSTSPAHAGKTFESKLAEWKLLKEYLH